MESIRGVLDLLENVQSDILEDIVSAINDAEDLLEQVETISSKMSD